MAAPLWSYSRLTTEVVRFCFSLMKVWKDWLNFVSMEFLNRLTIAICRFLDNLKRFSTSISRSTWKGISTFNIIVLSPKLRYGSQIYWLINELVVCLCYAFQRHEVEYFFFFTTSSRFLSYLPASYLTNFIPLKECLIIFSSNSPFCHLASILSPLHFLHQCFWVSQ